MKTAKQWRELLGTARGRALLVMAAAVAVVGVTVGPVYEHPFRYGKGDWQQYHQHDQVALTTIKDFGQVPLWSPYSKGGIPFLASSSPNFLSPFFIVKLIFGTALGTKIAFTLQFLVGFVLMFLLARDLSMGWPLCLFPAALFSSCAMIVVHTAGGHAWALPFLYYPGIIWGYRRAFRNLAWLPFPALLVALTILEGGIYPFPFLIILFGLYTISACFGGFPLDGPMGWRPDWRPIALSFCVFGLGILLGAPKLVPQIAYLLANPREVFNYDQIPVSMLWDVFTSRQAEARWPRMAFQNYKWWGEYSHFIGEAGVLLASAAIVLRFRKYPSLAIFCLVFILLMLGNHGPWSPYELLKRLPMYQNLRVPTRFGFLVVFHAVLLLSLGIQDLVRYLKRFPQNRLAVAGVRYLIPLVAVGLVADVAIQNSRWMANKFRVSEKGDPDAPLEEFRQVKSSVYGTYLRIRRNLGSPSAYEPNPIPKSRAIRRGDVPQFRLRNRRHGSARELYWTPNKLGFEVDLKRASTLIINQNHYRGWNASYGSIDSYRGLLAVQLPRGKAKLEVYFWPLGLTLGLVLGAFGILGCAAALAFGRGLALPPVSRPHLQLSERAGLAVAVGGPCAMVLVVLVASALFQPSYAELMAQAHEHLSQRWRKGDVLKHYPKCVGPSCKQFKKLSQVDWDRRPRLDGKEEKRMWLLFNSRAYDPEAPDRLKRRYRIAGQWHFNYLELTLLEPKRKRSRSSRDRTVSGIPIRARTK